MDLAFFVRTTRRWNETKKKKKHEFSTVSRFPNRRDREYFGPLIHESEAETADPVSNFTRPILYFFVLFPYEHTIWDNVHRHGDGGITNPTLRKDRDPNAD